MTEDEDAIEIKLNEKQHDVLYWLGFDAPLGEKKQVAILGGRGGGKSTIGVIILWSMKNEMPKAKGQYAFSATTKFKRAVMPGIKASLLDLFGETPYDFHTKKGDFALFREPPPDWDRPYQTPDDWSNCISWPNGFVVEVCGYQQDPDAVRSRNDDFIIIEEALKFKEEWLPAAIPCVRANRGKFTSRFHWAIIAISTPPFGPTGQWLYKWESESKTDPEHWYFTFIRTIDNQINLPPDYIESLRKTLLKIQFKVEVEGYRITRPEKLFYPSFNREIHAPEIESSYYSPFSELVASLDFNAHFTSASVYQYAGDLQHNCISAIFVKEPDEGLNMTRTWAIKFASEYNSHLNKRITITGDRNGGNKSSQVRFENGKWITPYEEVAQELENQGWTVINNPINVNPVGFDKYQAMSDVFSEKEDAFMKLRFDPDNALPVIISIENSPIKQDYSKDKSSETNGGDQERATHLSDTVDYYVFWVKNGGLNFASSGFDLAFLT